MLESRKKLYYQIIILLCIIVSVIIISIAFIFNISLIKQALIDYPSAISIVLLIFIRIGIVSITAIYLFKKWFMQDQQYLSDIPFLLGLFFLILVFGKLVDLLWDLTFYYLSDDIVLVFLKIRFFIIIFEVAPLIYLGLEIVLFSMEERYPKLINKKYRNRIRGTLITILIIVESIAILLGPTKTFMGMILPFILIPSLLGIVYVFYLAYKGGRLSVVKPKILTIGFFLYLISNIFRPLMQNLLGETPDYIIISEFVDIFIFIFILFGLVKKTD